MTYMSYCRFEEGYQDLHELYEAMSEEVESESESLYRQKVIRLCAKIVQEYGEDHEHP